ncbi:hypothetical protein BHE74_00034566 [Ensete ventricosum]|nr:hypothetical protein BHE74_00034566 [Ensete ventricosum]
MVGEGCGYCCDCNFFRGGNEGSGCRGGWQRLGAEGRCRRGAMARLGAGSERRKGDGRDGRLWWQGGEEYRWPTEEETAEGEGSGDVRLL